MIPFIPGSAAEAGPPGTSFSYLPPLEEPRQAPEAGPQAPRPSFPARKVEDRRVLSGADRIAYAALTLLWVAVVARFWMWWLAPAHRGSMALFVTASVCLAYLSTALPCFYWYFVRRMRRPLHMAPPAGRRVAMITLCVPTHESRDVIVSQLRALAAVDYPHDSWLLDEGGEPEIRALAEELGVRYFSRKGVPEYNEDEPPFQAKTKAGNVNAWLDHIEHLGLEYDVFVQLDIDHHPQPNYLDRTLGYFDDPDVAWVQAPSVCRNLDSWTARGLAEQEVVLQGPLQMGFYGRSGTPFIIGSHTSYRTDAIYDINGFQPTRAEDHLDTVVLAAAGFRGVYVPEIIAAGDGPEDLGTYLRQQFAWAYSMVQIFMRHTPRLVWSYRPSQAFQFLMAQSWYLLWSFSLAILWTLPIVALLTGHQIARVSLPEFLVYQWPVMITGLLMWWWSRRWFQPTGIGLTWRSILLEVARWPMVLLAVVNALLGVRREYMITPKGRGSATLYSGMRLYGAYLFLAAVALAAVAVSLFALEPGATRPYIILVLMNALTFVVLVLCALTLEMRDIRAGVGRQIGVLRLRLGAVCAALVAVAATGATIAFAWMPVLASLQ